MTMTYEQALAAANQRILNGTRAYNLARTSAPSATSPAATAWFAALMHRDATVGPR